MESTFKLSTFLNKARPLIHQSVRFKGIPRYNRTNWKPIPPRSHRKDDYKLPEPVHWSAPILRYQEKLAKTAGEPAPEPKEMHVVTRCKVLKGETKVCKELCEHFGMDKLHKPVIIANTPFNNTLLMQIKHLIRVKPLLLPEGFPKHPSDLMHTQLRTDGTLHVIPRLEMQEESEKPRLLQPKTVYMKNKKVVSQHGLLQDYFKCDYRWRYNEDGKEYSYKARNGS
ncbi:large ribosomal subunit protein uL30m-like [Watersipora subatra]|uniref:large ribosomal subunit protein uL30m-like n=1 Tax=Watersipora subatra TaxID=2589382 RepID=UPI00355C65A5